MQNYMGIKYFKEVQIYQEISSGGPKVSSKLNILSGGLNSLIFGLGELKIGGPVFA